MKLRLALGAVGVLMGLFGALRFLQRDLGQIVDSVLWLAGGVVVHDAILAPLTLAVVVLAGRVLPAGARPRVAAALVVVVTVTVVAIPVLGRFGARPDNVTLLDRDYLVGWLAVVALVLLTTLVVVPLASRRRRRAQSGG